MNLNGYFGADAVQAYGCVQCQDWHYEGDALYAAHLYRQSKHGVQYVKPRAPDGTEAAPARTYSDPAGDLGTQTDRGHPTGCDCSTCLGDGAPFIGAPMPDDPRNAEPFLVEDEIETGSKIVDLMAALKESLRSRKSPCRHGTPPGEVCERCILGEAGDELDGLHCPRCGAEHVWHGRDEKQRVCGECRFAE